MAPSGRPGGGGRGAVRVPQRLSSWRGNQFFTSGDWLAMNRPAGDRSPTGLPCYCLPANASVDVNGDLELLLKAQSYTDPSSPYPSGNQSLTNYSYTGCQLKSTRTFLYGTFKFRMRSERGGGAWPAIWTVGENCLYTFDTDEENGTDQYGTVCNWPNSGSGEIDLAELLPGDPVTKVNFQVHTSGNGQILYNAGVDLGAAKHDYEVRWTPGNLAFYFDSTFVGNITSGVPNYASFVILANVMDVGGNGSGFPKRTILEYFEYTP